MVYFKSSKFTFIFFINDSIFFSQGLFFFYRDDAFSLRVYFLLFFFLALIKFGLVSLF